MAQPSLPPQNPSGNRIDGLPDVGKHPAQLKRGFDISEASKGHQGPAARSSGPVVSPTVSMAPTTANAMQVGQTPVSRRPLPNQKASVPPPRPTLQGQAAPNRPAEAWPEATQRRLAQAIVEYLTTEPANRNKLCSIESILSLLRSNPTYPELCERLKSLGFALHRQNMARFLIKAVPDLNSNNTPQAQEQKRPESNVPTISHVQPTSQAETTPQAPPQALQASQVLARPPLAETRPMQPPQPPAPRMVVWNSKKAYSAPIPKSSTTPSAGPSSDSSSKGPGSLAQPGKPAQHKAVPIKLPPSRTSVSAPPAHTPSPASKAAAARKRLFSEIVDLSQLSNDEESDPAPKQPRVEEVPAKDPPGAVEEPHQPSLELNQSVPAETTRQPDSEPNQSTPAVAEGPRPDLTRFAHASSDEPTRDSIRRRPDLIQPLKDSAALDRVYYNPKTIARDILIAAGRHPTERPLNYHLIRLQSVFPCVTSKSDLATFRWDIVDPGGPPMPIVEPEDILTYPPPVPRKRRAAEKTSREKHGAGNKTPPASPPNKAPVEPPVQPSVQPPQPTTSSSSPSSPSPSSPPPSSSSIPDTPKVAENNTMTGANSSGSAPRRPGRPPGAKNKQPSKASLKLPKIEVAIPVPPHVPPPSYPIYQCDWDTCQAQLHDIQTLERHVTKVHIPGQTCCRWHGCPNAMRRYTGVELRKHLRLAHIQPLAWKLGDGPSVNGTGEKKAGTSQLSVEVSH
ncbi:hypothetical protein VTN77DRAFT_429 [Rasamsonia byssochlamydoides]|uniref:uncharacterized protein n=1 Tax=Rasamsonia byssochlamydoides TaxID=89139 RepID=UPI0037448DA2